MKRWTWITLAAAVAVSVSCGGGSSASSPTTPTPTPPPTGTGGNPSTATITIGANGSISPTSVTIAPGGRVTFVNNHTQAHDMSSNPHPEHTQCPEINQVGFLTPGQSRTTGNLNTARTCGFHDHNLPDNTALQGSIIIQ
ncbi:MAG: hypothetical protein ABI665_21710 [Vicinamibacterales bacterium]